VSEALIGLFGALVGASAATGTAVFLEWRRSHDEDRRWLRSTLEEAYGGVLLSLLRVEGVRSKFTIESGKPVSILTTDDVRRLFDALIDARSSLQRLVVFCSDNSRDEIAAADERLSAAASGLLGIGQAPSADLGALLKVSAEVRATVAACARRDLRRDVTF
jgi:hypothetical protein